MVRTEEGRGVNDMKRKCGWCGKDMGEKEPLDDPRETHGMCAECLWDNLRGIEKDLEEEKNPIERLEVIEK
jgi:hypothetical protein